MPVKVRISPALRRLVNSEDEVEGTAGTITSLLTELDRNYPGIAEMTLSGKAGKSINIYVNEKDMRFLGKEQAAVKDGDVVSIVAAISEG